MIKSKFVIAVFTAILPLTMVSAEQYKIHIRNVEKEVHKNWMQLPQTVDCTVSWELYKGLNTDWEPAPTTVLNGYEVLCFTQNNPSVPLLSLASEEDAAVLEKLPARETLGLVVRGQKDSEWVALSDTAWVTVGRVAASNGDNRVVWHHYIPISGRIPMALVSHADYFDAATRAGKAAFHLIWNFFIAGLIIWLRFCLVHLRFPRIFPLENAGRPKWRFAFDTFYKDNISKTFEEEIVEEWHTVIESSNKAIDLKLRDPQAASTTDVTGASIDHWKADGRMRVEKIKRLIEKNGQLKNSPTVKIIHAGLEKHELGGYHWLTASEKVDRAIESRAASELETLRRQSLMDWLWNLGTLSPLIGLFGTATGISNAFKNLVSMKVSQADLVRQLAGGINEALWTTIFGLAVSFFLMMLYFYYHNKLNWIYSKWEELYVRVSEKL